LKAETTIDARLLQPSSFNVTVPRRFLLPQAHFGNAALGAMHRNESSIRRQT